MDNFSPAAKKRDDQPEPNRDGRAASKAEEATKGSETRGQRQTETPERQHVTRRARLSEPAEKRGARAMMSFCGVCGETWDDDNLSPCSRCGNEYCYKCGSLGVCKRCQREEAAKQEAEAGAASKAEEVSKVE